MINSILTHAVPSWLTHQGPENDVVISTRIRLARNCTRHQFPHRASPVERTMVFEEVSDAFGRSDLRDSFDCVNFNTLDKRQQEFLVEERCASRDLASADGDRGVAHGWSGRISVMINEEDHVRVQCIDAGCRPIELWEEIDGVDDALGMRLDYAFDNRRGFLTCRPENAGTGLRVSFCAHLPGCVLTRTLDSVLAAAGPNLAAAGGFFGRSSPVTGSIFMLSGTAVMGRGESDFCDSMNSAMRSIADAERKARDHVLADAASREELTEKIQRSYATLCDAVVLGVDEFLDLASPLRFGIECTLFDKCTIDDLNRLTLFVLPAHLQTFLKKNLDDNEIREARAGLVRSFFIRNSKE
jgi:protein arginine kinase